MTFNMGYKSGSASVVFKFWPIQALLGTISFLHLNPFTKKV